MKKKLNVIQQKNIENKENKVSEKTRRTLNERNGKYCNICISICIHLHMHICMYIRKPSSRQEHENHKRKAKKQKK